MLRKISEGRGRAREGAAGPLTKIIQCELRFKCLSLKTARQIHERRLKENQSALDLTNNSCDRNQ